MLSICIPTYNRADVLKECIDAIVHHKLVETGNIEIVVCDNASTDGTDAVMKTYQDLEYVKYIQNEKNIGVRYNTLKVVDCATGTFRKLLNDYSIFTEDGLRYLYEAVISNMKDRPVLLFDAGKDESPTEITCHNIDDFVRSIGYRLTWMGVYGYWEEDWKELTDREKFTDKTFTTIDWLVQMFKRKRKAIVYQFNYTTNGVFNRTKRGYKFFKVFIQDYLDIWSVYVENRTISPALYNWIKKNLWPFAMGYSKNLLILRNDSNFDAREGWQILLKYYGKEWYFWWAWIAFPFDVIKRRINKGSK